MYGAEYFLILAPKIMKPMLKKLILLNQAISGENFSQSEYVAVSAISQFAFPPLARGDPSCIPSCKSFEHV